VSKYRTPPSPEAICAAVAEATHFAVAWKGSPTSARAQTVAEARLAARELTRADGQYAPLVYAVGATGRRMQVPDDFVA
jgi:hypothetical protein